MAILKVDSVPLITREKYINMFGCKDSIRDQPEMPLLLIVVNPDSSFQLYRSREVELEDSIRKLRVFFLEESDDILIQNRSYRVYTLANESYTDLLNEIGKISIAITMF